MSEVAIVNGHWANQPRTRRDEFGHFVTRNESGQQAFLFSFGAYGWTQVIVYEKHFDDALDEAVDWIVDHAPGFLCDEEIQEEYTRLIAERDCECRDTDPCDDCVTAAQEEAEADTTCAGGGGHHINSWEWSGREITRDAIKALITEHGAKVF